jgi:hypothetical protein
MPLNKLDSIIKNTEGRILYVSPSDLDATDSITNQGNSLTRPFKTVQRALIESARFSYLKGNNNDETEKTTILLMPGEHEIDNRPGYSITSNGTVATPDGSAVRALPLTLESNFDLTQKDNDLYKFNSVFGGVIVPRGTSIVGLDLRKTKVRPKYIPNPTDSNVARSAIFRVTGACYLWQFSIFDGDEFGLVYTQPNDFSIQSTPTFSHNKLTCFEYADGVNETDFGPTDLAMYYGKLSKAYGTGSGREIDSDDVFETNADGFAPRRPEFEIVGAFAADPITITNIESGSAGVPTRVVTVTTNIAHNLNVGTPIRITGVSDSRYNISTKVSTIDNSDNTKFTYTLQSDFTLINAQPSISGSEAVTIETDTVSGASPYIFNISMRSVWGMNGMHADGSKATGFRSMVVAQFTGVSLQKDDRAFVRYNTTSRTYDGITISKVDGSDLSAGSSSTGRAYHLESDSVYRNGWDTSHIKITNDAILQIVSVFAIGFNNHFEAQSGGDASITNSNSNFGQLSLVSGGFKKEAFEKDNKAFITHIIPPRAIESVEENIDWLQIDLDASNTTTKLYLFGFENESIKPPILTQGYRVGAKVSDKIFLNIGGTEYSADILMPSGESSFDEYSVGAPNSSNVFTLSSGTHNLTTGERVIIISDDADYPENLQTNTVYYAIAPTNTTIKLAASEAEALAGDEITVSGGTNLKIITRVSDKQSGDFGHPVQWDGTAGQWYITTRATGNTVQPNLSGTGASETTFIKRLPDNRSLDDKIYKTRVVIPNQYLNSKTPEAGFILQESSTTGVRANTDFTATSISASNTNGDYDFNRNPRFISTCSYSGVSDTVTVVTELPHNLNVGDRVFIRNVTDSTNTAGDFNKGYNGDFTVTSVTDALTFIYALDRSVGSFTNDVSNRTTSLPRFERNDLQSNIYIYRNEVISEYDETNNNGVYHTYLLNASNSISGEFTNFKYSQRVTDLYPQLDRDNYNDNPQSAKSFALRSPIGDVSTNDLKKSITRESVDLLLTSLNIGLPISSVANSPTSATITFDRDHGLGSIVTGTTNAITSGFTNGTYYNVKIYNNISRTEWDGATAKVVVSGGAIISVTIMNGGSGYSARTYYLDTGVIGTGNGNNDYTVSTSGISAGIGNVVQFTGVGNSQDTYHRISSIPARNKISIAKTSGDATITSDHYALAIAPSTPFTAVGNIITANSHGLVVGNKFKAIDNSNNDLGNYIVDTVTDVNTFTVTGGIGGASGYILKHGLSSNEGVSDRSDENLQSRGITIFANDSLLLSESGGINSTETSFAVSHSGIGTAQRFPLGSYISVDDEIMRIASNTLGGVGNNEITVIRGALATKQSPHVQNSLIKKIKVPSIEFRRPSILRASGHTFEYLGYGPGNYSTALPQVQEISLSEKEEFLSQSQERSSGIVVYTGMNNRGDFFIGNQKKSSATGEEVSFDVPIPTVTGEDPSRLSVVFDEVTIKERLVVEGGASGEVLSQFDGPVTFSKDVRIKEELKVTGDTTLKNLSSTTNTLPINDNVDVDGDITADSFIATTPSFTNINGNDIYHLLRSNGTQSLISGSEVVNALGYTPADSGQITGDFPLGNSIVVDDISSQFNSSTTDFALLRSGAAFIPAGSSANVIVSLGGVIQKPSFDYLILQSGGENTNTIRFSTPPQSGVSCFIIGLGGQGSLISNIDWDNKGEIIVATGNNSATKVQVGQNGYALTADSNATMGVSWQPSVPRGSVFYVATATTPSGYLYCNGDVIPTSGSFLQDVNAALLQELRNLLGETYGVFGQLPDLVDRFVGYSATPGASDGSADAIVVQHNHTATSSTTISPNPHNHSLDAKTDGRTEEGNGDDGGAPSTDTTNAVNLTASTTTTIGNAGQSGTNANLPPYLGMRPIIKY